MRYFFAFVVVLASMLAGNGVSIGAETDDRALAEGGPQVASRVGGQYVLRSAWEDLRGVKGLSEDADVDSIDLLDGDVWDNVDVAMGAGLDPKVMSEARAGVLGVLQKLGYRYVINGGVNGLVGGLVLSNRVGQDENEMLLVAWSMAAGYVGVLYGSADDETVRMIQKAPLMMEGDRIQLLLGEEKGSHHYMINIK